MEIKEIVGNDFSKETFDAHLHSKGIHSAFENSENGFKKFKKWLQKHLGKDLTGVVTVLEHTGLYSYSFEEFMHKSNLKFWKVPALEIKRSMGIVRGKNDKIDANRIASYGKRNLEKMKLNTAPDKAVFKLKNLISLRDKLVRDKAGYQARMKEQKACLGLSDKDVMIKVQKTVITELTKHVKKVEEEIKNTIKENEGIKQSYDLLTSIKGVGLVLSTYMIAYTENFTKFEDARQFACYVGIAPFPYQSGTSIRGKTKVSQLAFKKIKNILHLCASSAVQNNKELKAYYERRLSMGKTKMSTLNVVRNKLVYRIFAVIKRGTNYTEDILMAA